MKIRTIVTMTVLILALITISTTTTTAAATSCNCGDICVNETGWWRDGGAFTASKTPIQAAVDNATAGETIFVAAGSYTENVDIATPHLTLRGEGAGVVTVTAASSSDHVFEVIANYVNISGFTATGAMGYSYAGIYLNAVDHCNISENTASNNNHGIDLHISSNNTLTSNNVTSNSFYGIDLFSSNNNTLTSNIVNSNSHCGIYLSSSSANALMNNTASNNCYGIDLFSSSSNTLVSNIANSNSCCGIYLYKSSSNTFASNTANSNNHRGIYLRSSSNNTLASNTMSENMYNFDVSGSSHSEYTHNIDTSNTMDGKPIYYWVDQKDRQVPSDAGFVGVVNGTNITVRDLTLRNNWKGVLFAYTENSRIENVTTSNNYYSIILDSSRNNTLVSNTVSKNKCGIGLSSSSNNTLTGNNANSNNYFGIYLSSSRNNMLANNNVKLNGNHGIYLDSSRKNTLVNNNANSNGNGIYLDSSSNNMLVNNNAILNNDGICLYESSNNNTLANNNANSNGDYGIYLYESSNNMLTSNNANSNGDYGIRLCDSSDNLIYNNYFNNTNNAHDDGSNQWNTTKTNGINIIGGPFLGGNYWSDYVGVDNDGDGLGDTRTPYNPTFFITYDGDYHPLVPTASLDLTYIPPDPVNLTYTLGNYRVYYTWSQGAGNVTDSYNVNLNGIWMNGTTSTFLNTSVGLEGWANITVYAYNASGTGTQSSGCVSDSMQAPAPPVCNCTCSDICVNETGWWRDGCAFTANTTPIQAAVDNATAGETICVAAGSYTENVVIRTSHLTLRGEGAGVVTVTAALSSDHVFEVIANYVNILGFTATGTMGYSYAGIYLDNANHCNISENYCSNNYCGIYLHFSSSNMLKNNNADSNLGNGIRLDYSSNNTLAKNNANLNGNGIYLDSSRKNTLTSNNANSNNNYGIHLSSSSDNTLARNNANLNSYYGIYLSSSSDNTLARNNASNNNYGIFLSFSSDNTLANNNANSNGNHGIYLSSSSDNTLANNNANSNNDGIYLYSSSNNTLTSNTASNNDYYSIRLGDSSDNLICNNYFNNTNNAYDNDVNQWNTIKTNGTNIIGGLFLGGNYWSDYSGVDNDGDGLGDTLTPYNSLDYIENGGDYHPLVMLDNTPLAGITYLHNITHARTYINWTWTDPADSDFSKVMVYLDGIFQENVTSGVQCYNATSLTSGTTYDIGTLTVDTTGNINHTWVNHTATTASTTDTTAPVISNVENTDLTTDSVSISWITYENSDSVVRYSTTSGNYTNEKSNTALVTLHNIPLSGLSEETTYYYMVYSTDASGNTGESSEYNFTTAAIFENTTILIGDAIATPNSYAFTSIMVNNVTDLGSGSISVTYNSSVVHVTNVTSGDGNALAIQDWNVDNTAGLVLITAWDAVESHNGNVVFANVTFHAVGEYPDSTPLVINSSELIDYTSYDSIGHSVTNGTFSIIDNQPPVITDAIATLDVILNDNGRPRIPGTNITVLNATVLNGGSGVANVTINLSSIGGSDDQVMERVAGTDIWTVATNATDGINLTHELVVTATDAANNTNTSVIGLTVLLRGDVVRDGDLNSADALYIAKYLVGKEPIPSLFVGDMSPDIGDGKITSADALYLAKYLVGKEAAP